MKINAPSNYYGPYQLELQFGSTEGGLEKKTLQGNVIEDKRIDYTHRPNVVENLGLNYYGSGKIVNPFDNQPISESDLTRLAAVANGTFRDDNDKRLRDRCDLNGDTYVNLQDVELLRAELNGTIPYLPGDWDNLPTRAEKEDWAKKMFAIDKTNKIPFPGAEGDCNQFTDQTYINFHGVSATDIPKFQQVYNYDFKDNGRFNLPLEEVIIIKYDAEGKLLGGHTMNAFIFGDPSLFGNLCPAEPQRDHMNVPLAEDPVIGINSKVYIRGSPIIEAIDAENDKMDISMTWYVKYNIKNKIATLTWVNPNLINEGGK